MRLVQSIVFEGIRLLWWLHCFQVSGSELKVYLMDLYLVLSCSLSILMTPVMLCHILVSTFMQMTPECIPQPNQYNRDKDFVLMWLSVVKNLTNHLATRILQSSTPTTSHPALQREIPTRTMRHHLSLQSPYHEQHLTPSILILFLFRITCVPELPANIRCVRMNGLCILIANRKRRNTMQPQSLKYSKLSEPFQQCSPTTCCNLSLASLSKKHAHTHPTHIKSRVQTSLTKLSNLTRPYK